MPLGRAGSIPAQRTENRLTAVFCLLYHCYAPVLSNPCCLSWYLVAFLFYQLNSQGFMTQFSASIPKLIDLFTQMPKGLLIMGGILFFVILLGIYLFLMTFLDYFGRSVKMIEGVGQKKISTTKDDDGSTTTRIYYVISGQKFSVKKRAFLAFEYGRNYRAYYTPRRKVLVNIEAIN